MHHRRIIEFGGKELPWDGPFEGAGWPLSVLALEATTSQCSNVSSYTFELVGLPVTSATLYLICKVVTRSPIFVNRHFPLYNTCKSTYVSLQEPQKEDGTARGYRCPKMGDTLEQIVGIRNGVEIR
jgi:hypothetical protein